MLSIVTWKWPSHKKYRSSFTSTHVNVMRRMVLEHYPHPHKFLCVTNDPKGLAPDIGVIPDTEDFAPLTNPTDKLKKPHDRPACYRRLRAFQPDIGKLFGPRFIMLDLDMVLVGDVSPIFNRVEDMVMYCEPGYQQYNGSMLLLTAGARPKVWRYFAQSPSDGRAKAVAAGYAGSDQAWISYCLWPREPTWTPADGVYSYLKNNIHLDGVLPPDARIVNFHGRVDPWSPISQSLDWVRRYWGEVECPGVPP